jgi:flagellar protein FlaG
MNIPSLNSLAPAAFAATRQSSTDSTNATPDTQPAKAINVSEQALQAAREVQPSRQELDKAVKAVNDFVGEVNSSLNFSVDDDTGQTVVKVIDIATKEVIKQFPSEEMLAIAKALDSIKGLLVQQKA